jgi:hypothetical protein
MAVCPNCGTQVPNNSKFCTECGQVMTTPAAAPTPAGYPGAAPTVEKPARSGHGKLILIISLAVLLLAGATVGVLFLTGVLGGNKDYDRAMDLYKSGNYAEAAALFEQLGDYEDSWDMARTCRYQQAQNAYLQEDYETALTLFTNLGSYRDSADWAQRCEKKLVKGPSGKYVGYLNGDVFSTVTFKDDGTFTELLTGQTSTWYGTWVMDATYHITSTYDDGSHDYYVWDPTTDTLDWKGEGRIIYRKTN